MRTTLIDQYNHAWKMFHLLVTEFDQDSWSRIGISYIIPARIAYHIIGGVDYYTENKEKITLLSGKENNWNWETAPIEELPAKDDVIDLIRIYKSKTSTWINEYDLDENNDKFCWTGTNKLSVILFLLRHIQYHIGELNLLLHFSKNGNASDNWVKALGNIVV